MMKNRPGLWLLLSAGVLWLRFQDVSCVRATSLIFGKSTTTSTSTTLPPDASSSSNGNAAEPSSDTIANMTQTAKSNYTGIPQVDYQWDPNLPRELNGFNLTEYPFYDRLPEDIDFKCDGLHDGFYASVPHKCQVYHHCLFGTRYDFLCANYTAFDQKTFICHFVSEVDCANSKKFWHRNDALYEAASTTTVKPQPPPSAPTSARRPQNHASSAPRRRKPTRRRRPQYDYYDEYEEDEEAYYDEPRYTATEPSRRRNKRPRPRPRPVYDDEYDDYEDERYDRRRGSSRRGEDDRRYKPRPSARRSNNKDDRRKHEDDYEAYDEDARFDRTEDRRTKKPKDTRRPTGEKHEEHEDRRPRPRKGGPRRPIVEEPEYEDQDEMEETPLTDDKDKTLVKPIGSSVYDRPRVAPKIRPPVPRNEADKYAYKTTIGPAPTQAAKPMEEEEYYEEYEEDLPKKKPSTKDSQADASITSNARKTNNRDRERERERDTRRSRPRQHTKRPAVDEEEYYEEEEERPSRRPQTLAGAAVKPKNEDRRVGQGSRKRPASVEYEEEYEERGKATRKEAKTTTPSTPMTVITTLRRKFGGVKDSRTKPTSSMTTSTSTTTTTTTSTTPAPQRGEESMGTIKSVRIVKRPFLPSRGGNPYQPRGLQPIGLKSESVVPSKPQETRQIAKPTTEPAKEEIDEIPLIPQKSKDVVVEDYRPILRPSGQTTFRHVYQTVVKEPQGSLNQSPKPADKNPLDINENEYDVTLNDALNPTLPNLPLRTFPSGFSNNVNNEYAFNPFNRQRYVADATINQASSDYHYRIKQPIVQSNGHAPQSPLRQPESHQDFSAQYSHNYQQFRLPPTRLSHTQTFYAAY